MAYDLVLHKSSGRDWSMGAGGTARRSLAYHAEMQTREKILALAKLVNVEVKNNTAYASVRERGGSLPALDGSRFTRFALAWGSWYSRNIESGQPVSNATIADLERWRSENADWTKRLTAPIPLPAVSTVASLTRPSALPVGEKTSKAPWVLGLIGAAFLALSMAKGRR